MVVIEARVVDGTHLELAHPIQDPSGAKVFVCLAEAGDADDERRDWLAASAASLAGAYGESEPEYSLNPGNQ
ncbi:MAG: hypothetical protein HZB26_03895 [Candidatus Hydrogenedentes bacterium]|nr:hypothetical protein [Candidatus Hydrogenedentota bacterium]